MPKSEKLKQRKPAGSPSKLNIAIHATSEVTNQMYAKMHMKKNRIEMEREHSTNQIGGMIKFLIPLPVKENRRRK